MRRKLTKSKAPLSRQKVQERETGQNDSELNATVKNDGAEVTKTVVSPKLKCYSKTHLMTASSSNDDQCKTSAFDYNSDENTCITVIDRVAPLGLKRKRGSCNDDESTNLQGTSRYKKSQQAINLIKESDKKEKKYGKKRKGRKDKSSTSSDEEDFDQPVKKFHRLLVPDSELVKVTSITTQGRSKKSLLNLKKNKRNVGRDDQHSEESNVDSATELGTVNQKHYPESAEDDADGDDERDEDPDNDNDEGGIDILEHHDNKRTTKLENEPETMKEKTVKTVSEIKCPVCSKVFDKFVEQEEINEHVNSCLDSKVTTGTVTEIPENNPKSSLSILKVQLIDFEYQRKEVERRDVGFGGEDGLFFCHICQKDLSKMNSQRRQQHINKCCDQMEKVSEEEKVQATGRDDARKNTLTCPFCSQEFKAKKSWQAHLKKCAQENNVPPSQLIEIAKQQEQYQQEMESTSHQTEERARGRPNGDGKKKTGQARKKQKVGQDLRNVDEETQLAMALSASMAPPAPPGNDDRKPKRKRKKDNEVIPALLLRSKEETQSVIAARAAQVVCNKDDDSDEDSISCTPALAPSTLAEQFLKVEKANANVIVKEEAKKQVKEETKGCFTEASNQDKKELKVKEDILCTPDTYSKSVSSNFEDTSVVFLSDMLASPDMCKSFLSFLDVPDEEATTAEAKQESSEKPTIEVKKDPSEQPGMSVMVGRSAPLWSMASLGNPESSTKDFYVPGLLQIQMPSPKPSKKTPRKSSSTSQRKGSAHVETREEIGKNTEKNRQEMIRENRKEETSDKPNKIMSESELTSASQVANLDILLELADSVDDDDDYDNDDDGDGDDGDGDDGDGDSQEQSRKSSVDHKDDDEDEVFPSSGFCLPVGPNNQPDKVDSNVPSSLSLFLRDMSKMVGNKMLSDVTISTKGNENIPAHSFMLASRSQILANMIRKAQNITDGQQPMDNPVHLAFNDVESNAMRCILQYIYTASVDVPQSCIVDVIGLADRLELLELVKACQDSRTIDEELHEKQGSEDQEENGIRCSLSAEQLLDAIWQDGTESVETKQDNQEESQDEWNEGFDDDDIEEVRIFQTQAVRKRTCSEDTCQDLLEEILILDAKNEEKENEDVQIFSRTPSETDLDSKKSGVKVEELQVEQTGIKLSFMQESRKEREVLEAEGEDDHLETAATMETGCSEEKESKKIEVKELKHQKDDIGYCYRKDVCDDKRRDGTHGHGEGDFGKRDTSDDQGHDINCEDEAKQDKCNTFKEKEQNLMSDIQMTGIMCYDVYDENDKHDDDDDDDGWNRESSHDCHSVHDKVDLTEDDDDGHDDADENNGAVHDHDETSQDSVHYKVDLTEDDDDGHDDADENNGSVHDHDETSQDNVHYKVDLTEDDDGHDDDADDDDDQNDVQNRDKNTSQDSVKPGKFNLTEGDGDAPDDGENNGTADDTIGESVNSGKIHLTDEDVRDNGRKTSRVSDQNVSPSEFNEYRNIDKESGEHQSYDNIDEESEEEYGAVDIAMLNQSISLLSDDDDDCQSPEKVPQDNDLIIPETPHPKKRQRYQSPEDDQGHKKPSQYIIHPSDSPISYSPPPDYDPYDLSSEYEDEHMNRAESERDNVLLNEDDNDNDNDNEKDHVSEDEEVFLEKLKSRVDAKAKNAEKEKKKGKGKKKSPKNRSRNNKSPEDTQKGLPSSHSSCSPRVSKPINIPHVVDLSMDNEIEDLTNESASNQVDSGTRESDLEQDPTIIDVRRSNKDDQESCSSLSSPRMVSPRVPSPCYSDFDHEMPSSAVSPIHPDVAVIDVDHSPVTTTPMRQFSTELQDSRSPKAMEGEGGVHQEAIESDQEGDPVALLPEPAIHEDGKTQDGENKNKLGDNKKKKNRTRFKISGDIDTKPSLFKRLRAAKYGLESTETEVSSDEESVERGLDDTPKGHSGNSQTVSQTKRPGNNTPKSRETTSNSAILSQNDFYDDGGYNCDVDDFGACLGGDDSFMAYAAEQIESIKKQDKPVTQEKPDHQVGLVKPRTTAQAQTSAATTPRNNRTRDTSADSPITPMPNYDDMTTPDLKIEVKKFGVRALPKKKMKAKLIEIYHYTHPGAAAQQTQVNDKTKKKTSQTTKVPAKVTARTAKPSTKTVASSQPTREPAKKKRIPVSQVRESSDSDDDGRHLVRASSQRPASFKPSSSNTSNVFQRKVAPDIDAGISRSCSLSQPASTSRRTENNAIQSASSLSDDDRGTGRGSSESNNEEQEEFGEVSILVDRETDTASQQVNSDDLDTKLLSFIESNQDVYLKVISYQPIDLVALHELIKSSGIKCRVGQLIDFLDTQGITFTTAGQKPRQRRKPTRKPTRKKR